jgi:hypothetical protein
VRSSPFYKELLGLTRTEDSEDWVTLGEFAAPPPGARVLDGSDRPIGYRVYADPVGHPFCLVTPEALT